MGNRNAKTCGVVTPQQLEQQQQLNSSNNTSAAPQVKTATFALGVRDKYSYQY